MNKCEHCGSTEGSIIRHSDGEVSGFSCHKCGRHTSFYHITEKGREILRILLDPQSSPTKETI